MIQRIAEVYCEATGANEDRVEDILCVIITSLVIFGLFFLTRPCSLSFFWGC